MLPQLVGEGEDLAADRAGVAGELLCSSLAAVLTRQVVLQVVSLHKSLIAMLAAKLSLRLVSQLVLLQAPLLCEGFLTNTTREGFDIRMEPHVKL